MAKQSGSQPAAGFRAEPYAGNCVQSNRKILCEIEIYCTRAHAISNQESLESLEDPEDPESDSIDSIDSRITKVRSTRICTKFIVLIYIDMLIVLAKWLACYLAFLGP